MKYKSTIMELKGAEVPAEKILIAIQQVGAIMPSATHKHPAWGLWCLWINKQPEARLTILDLESERHAVRWNVDDLLVGYL